MLFLTKNKIIAAHLERAFTVDTQSITHKEKSVTEKYPDAFHTN